MKKNLLTTLLLTAPFFLNAQVKAPGTAEASFSSYLTRTGWTVTSNSGNGPDGPYASLFDGDPGTYWNSDYLVPATNVYPHILTIDMLSAQSYEGIMIRPRHNTNRAPRNMTFRKSDDGVLWTDITSVVGKNGVLDQLFYLPATQTSRYLQVEITTGYGDNNADLAEIAPFKTTLENSTYSRIGWLASGSSTQGSGGVGDDGGYEATLDNNASTYWHSQWSPATTLPQYLEYDMLQALTINKISLVNRPVNTSGRFTMFTVSYKLNTGDTWTTLPGTFASPLANPATNNIPLGADVTARYIRLDITGTGGGQFAMLSEFRAHYDNVLPVELTSFTAKANGSLVSLKWNTATETNASHFMVNRSTDGSSFSPIGKVGVTGAGSMYNFTDFSPLKGYNYYQLQTIDFDGTSATSKVEVAKVAASGSEITVSSISENSVTINVYTEKATSGSITASTVTGQKISHNPIKLAEGNNSIAVATGASKGLVILTLATTEGTLTKKVVK